MLFFLKKLLATADNTELELRLVTLDNESYSTFSAF